MPPALLILKAQHLELVATGRPWRGPGVETWKKGRQANGNQARSRGLGRRAGRGQRSGPLWDGEEAPWQEWGGRQEALSGIGGGAVCRAAGTTENRKELEDLAGRRKLKPRGAR